MHRKILNLSVPNIITNITVPLLGLVDLAMMGHLDNPIYIGAIALGGTIFSVIYSGFGFLRMGTSGFTAQAYGGKLNTELQYILARSIVVALLLAMLLIILQYPIQWVAFSLLEGGTEVEKLAKEYFYIRILAAPATLCLYALYGWFLGMQNARIPMFIAISINLINITFNFVFIKVFGMKADGVAWASVLAQYSGLILAVIFLFTHFPKYMQKISLKMALQLHDLKRFFKVNSDIFIRTLLLIFALAFFTAQSAKISDNLLAINSLLFQFFFIFSFFLDGFAYAGEAMVGKAKGADDMNLLKKTIRYLFVWNWGMSLLFFVLFFTGIRAILGMLTSDQALIGTAMDYKYWVILLPLTSGAAFIWDGIYIGVTASKAMRNTMIIASLMVFLPSYYLGAAFFGNHGLWLALNLFMLSRSLLMWIWAKYAIYA